MSARAAGRLVGRGSLAVRLARWRLIRLVAFLIGAFVAFNGVTGLVEKDGAASHRVAGAAVVVLGVAVWLVLSRLAGERPRRPL